MKEYCSLCDGKTIIVGQPNPYANCPCKATQPEPAPIRTDEAHIWDLVIEDMKTRLLAKSTSQVEKTMLDAVIVDMKARASILVPPLGSDPLEIAYESSLDMAYNLRQALERGYPVDELYQRALGTVVLCKAALMAMGV